MHKLIVNPGTDQTWEIPLSPGVTILGSEPSGAYPIAHETVAAAHCLIRVDDSRVAIHDLGTGYGTFVSHAPVAAAEMKPGQILTLGAVDLELVSDGVTREVAVNKVPLAPRLEPIPPSDTGGSSPTSGTARQYQPPPALPMAADFFGLLPGVTNYPIQGRGLILLVAGTVFFVLLNLVASLASIGYYGGVVTGLAGVAVAGYLFSYAKSIITSTIENENEPPGWPDVTDWEQDILMPCGQLVALVVLTFGPAIILQWWHPFGEAYAPATMLVAAGLGGLLAPMGMLTLAVFDSVAALNPVALVWSILRIPGHYLVAAVAFELAIGAGFFADNLIGALIPVPVLPGVLSVFIGLYLTSAGMRILGLLYRTQRERLGWFGRSDRHLWLFGIADQVGPQLAFHKNQSRGTNQTQYFIHDRRIIDGEIDQNIFCGKFFFRQRVAGGCRRGQEKSKRRVPGAQFIHETKRHKELPDADGMNPNASTLFYFLRKIRFIEAQALPEMAHIHRACTCEE